MVNKFHVNKTVTKAKGMEPTCDKTLKLTNNCQTETIWCTIMSVQSAKICKNYKL